VCVVGILTKTESLNLLGVEMNALELADELDDMLKAIGLTDNRVPTMLRQQQAEIDRLLTIAEDFQMLIVKQKDEIEALKQSKFDGNNKVNFQLTDEEIIEIAKDYGYANRYELNIQFARAILRKASEK